MDKTITMIINETRKNLAQVCNASQLPPCILELLIKNLYNEVNVLVSKQLQEDELAYASSLMEEPIAE